MTVFLALFTIWSPGNCKSSRFSNVDVEETKVCTCSWSCPKHGNIAAKGSKQRMIRNKKYKSSKSIQKIGFRKITPYANNLRSREKICALANDIGIRKIFDDSRYQFLVETLFEMTPVDPTITSSTTSTNSNGDRITSVSSEITRGVNMISTAYSGGGMTSETFKVGIVLRSASGSFWSYGSVVDTLLHELAHCHHENHSERFYAEWNYLRNQYNLFNPWYSRYATTARRILGNIISIQRKAFKTIRRLFAALRENVVNCFEWVQAIFSQGSWEQTFFAVYSAMIGAGAVFVVASHFFSGQDPSHASVNLKSRQPVRKEARVPFSLNILSK